MAHRARPRVVAACILALLAVTALGHRRLRRLASQNVANQAATSTPPQPAPQPADAAPSAVRGLRKGERLDINRADAVALRLLPGVGPKLAMRILRYRRRHGSFSTLDDLAQVPGIGPKTLQKLRPLAKAEPQKHE